MPATATYALVMFAAGIGIPILAALNANLGARVGSPAAAATILFVVAFAGAAAVMLATGGARALALAPVQPKPLFLAGLLVAFYVLSITWIAPHFGVGNAVFLVLLGQLVAAATIDHYGLFGATPSPLTLTRAGGIALMAAGVALTQKVQLS
ncbi:MAG: DMT family transporter [Rhodobacteraceae bacterium]|nr:DMT family transporter [Paracoccaceae bacterium]